MKSPSPLTFRLEPELHRRLEECAARTRIKKYTLALLAMEAAVEAIEKNDYQLVVPIKFNVASVPTPSSATEARATGTRPSQGEPSDSHQIAEIVKRSPRK